MRPYATADLETDPFKLDRMPEAFSAGFYDGKVCQIFWGKKCIPDLIKAIFAFSKKFGANDKPLIYFHNGGKFDAHFILAELLKVLEKMYGTKELKLFCIGSRMVEIETPDFSVRDSYALIPKPLRTFSKKEEIEIEKLEADVRDIHRDEICKYLRQDCVGLYEGLGEFFNLYGCGITLASTAFKILSKDFGGKTRRTSSTYDERFRKAFFAGRVQFFSLGRHGNLDGRKRFEIVDINSSFPYAMTFQHWFSDNYTMLEKVPKEFKEQCFYEVICDSDGILPVREENGGVNFPTVTQQKFFVVGWELFNAIKLKKVRNVRYEMIFMPESVNDFSAYVNHFYALKKNAPTPAEREFAKLFLNAAYGKYAQDSRSFSDSIVTKYGSLPDPRISKKPEVVAKNIRKNVASEIKKAKFSFIGEAKGKKISYGDSTYFILSGVQLKDSVYLVENWSHLYDDEKRGLSFWSLPSVQNENVNAFNNVAVGASITAFARARLAEAMSKCEGVLYCDTDSILAANTSKLEKSPDELGKWKTEKECDAVWIGGKKLYCAHSIADFGAVKKPEKTNDNPKGKFYREVHLPQFAFHRWYLTKKDFDSSWKLASKGVKLSVENLIAVCEGEERKYSFDAPNYSVRSAPHFTTRTVRRDDKRKKR